MYRVKSRDVVRDYGYIAVVAALFVISLVVFTNYMASADLSGLFE